jgi:hypothetical protein
MVSKSLIFAILTLFPTVGGFAQSHSKPLPQEERAALIALYESTDGPHWKENTGWVGAPGTECDWHGVSCGPRFPEEHVLSVDLFENGLTGRIPEAIGQLGGLEWLTLFGNKLSGRLPQPLIDRWLAGSLRISVEPALLTDVSEIDFETNASSLLCAHHRVILRSDATIVNYTTLCRNASRNDRKTYCEVKKGRTYEFASLAWLLQKNAFYALKHEYSRNVTDAGFEKIRVKRDDKPFEVSNYAGGGPFELWTILRAIEGVASSVEWKSTTKQDKCPEW